MLTVSRVTGTTTFWVFWTSGSDQAKESTWIFTGSDSKFNLTQYIGKINRGTNNNCMHTGRDGSDLMSYYDGICSYPLNFICEMSCV
jgi:hypothetical protein